MWVVYNQTNYGNGIYFGGIYRSRERALQRLRFCEQNLVENDTDTIDSWHMTYLKPEPIKSKNLI